MPHNLRSTELGVLQRVEVRGDGGHYGVQGGEKPVQKQQGAHGAICSKQGLEQDRVVGSGIVQYQHHARATRAMPPQHLQKGREHGRVERGAQRADKLAGAQTDGPKQGLGTSSIYLSKIQARFPLPTWV